MTQPHFEKVKDRDGTLTAILPNLALMILPDGESRVFSRNAVAADGKGSHRRIMVGELNGVRVYVETRHGIPHLIMTTQDLYFSHKEPTHAA